MRSHVSLSEGIRGIFHIQRESEGYFTYRRRQCEIRAQRELKTLALKFRVIQPEAKECWQLPEGGRGRE